MVKSGTALALHTYIHPLYTRTAAVGHRAQADLMLACSWSRSKCVKSSVCLRNEPDID